MQFWFAYITLLPKKDDAASIRDFRPISLVHSFAKLITKLLANRLAGRLDQLVSPNQNAFIKCRFILDNFMLVQHTTKFMHQQKQARFLLKLDITKAFDTVSWDYLPGFSNRWRTGLLLYSQLHPLQFYWMVLRDKGFITKGISVKETLSPHTSAFWQLIPCNEYLGLLIWLGRCHH